MAAVGDVLSPDGVVVLKFLVSCIVLLLKHENGSQLSKNQFQKLHVLPSLAVSKPHTISRLLHAWVRMLGVCPGP